MFFAISGAYIFYIYGIGYLVTNALCQGNDDARLIEKIPFCLVTGYLINFSILLVVQSLELSSLLGIIVSCCGLVWLLMRWKKEKEMTFRGHKDWLPVIVISAILILYYVTILCEPLEGWDARSIWFFHAKMIWSAGSISPLAGWNHPSLEWGFHVDYPKLIPGLAAQWSYVLGYWNEYAPKFALFLLLIPAVLWIFSFYSRRLSFLLLVLMFPFGLSLHLWIGLVDGYVAFYAVIFLLLSGRYFQKRRLIDLLSALSCLALLSNIKNEGILIALLGLVSIIMTGMISDRIKVTDFKKIFSPYHAAWLALIAAPFILWSIVYKNKWHLTNDLQIGTVESFFRLSNRLFDGVSFPFVLKETFFHSEGTVRLAFVMFSGCVIYLILGKRHIFSWIQSLFIAVAYYFCLVIIYLITPHDLKWQLTYSVSRTMLPVSSCLIAGIYFILKELEDA